jgi:hypothetical protein
MQHFSFGWKIPFVGKILGVFGDFEPFAEVW